MRLFDGAGDGLPGLIIDDFAGRWIVQTMDECEPTLDPAAGYRSLYWKPLLKTSKAGPKHIGGEPVQENFCVLESGLEFEIDFRAGYSPGLFLDQRINRNKLRSLAKDQTLLNTFSYTCAFGVAAAIGGASTVNLDLVTTLSRLGKTKLRNQSDQLGQSRFYLRRCFRLVGTFSATREKI